MPSPGEKKRNSKTDKKRKTTTSPTSLLENSPEMADVVRNCLSTPVTGNSQQLEEDCPAWARLIIVQISDLSQKLQNIDTSVKNISNKIDRVESKLHATIRTVDAMSTDVREIRQQVTGLENSIQFQSTTIDELSDTNLQYEAKLQVLESCVDESRRVNATLQEDILDLKTRSMRDNLVFYNIPEKMNEDAEETIREFCATKLDMRDTIDDIKIDRAHRMGKRYDNKTRPFVVKFNYFKDKEYIKHRAFKLRGSRFGISDQYPMEIRERRKQLLPILKEAKEQGKRANLVVDKLFIDGRQYNRK